MALTRPQKLVLAIGLFALLGGVFVISLRAPRGTSAEPVTLEVEQPAQPEEIVVHVVGQVNRPGVYRLRSGARAGDAVRAAGGFTSGADVATVNLAAVLEDGRQVAVGALPQSPPQEDPPAQAVETAPPTTTDAAPSEQALAPPAPAPRRGSPATSPAASRSDAQPQITPPPAKISINRAGLEELQQLPGIGEKMAKRILYYRYERGGFSSIEDLLNVNGIGQDTLEQIKPYITL